MDGMGSRLREERERLGLTQRAFGDIGGVEANAQGKYESGERTPKADYLAAVAACGVDALYVLRGVSTPCAAAGLSAAEQRLLSGFRHLSSADQQAIEQVVRSLAGDAAAKARGAQGQAVSPALRAEN